MGQSKAQIQGSRSTISDHSVRKTGTCRLLQNDVHPLHVSQLTGHKNPDSLKHYYVASTNQRKKKSDIINASDHSKTSSSSSSASSPPNVKSNQVKRACPENFSGPPQFLYQRSKTTMYYRCCSCSSLAKRSRDIFFYPKSVAHDGRLVPWCHYYQRVQLSSRRRTFINFSYEQKPSNNQ